MSSKPQRLVSALVALGSVALLVMGACKMSSQRQEVKDEKRQYYKSWATYQIPMKPKDPIDYKDTEPLNSFYLATYDDGGRLKRFVKYHVEREDLDEIPLTQGKRPDSIVYFEALPPKSADAQPAPGNEISYDATEGLTIYIRGQVNDSGAAAWLQKVGRRVFFIDEYTYWPNNKLKGRVMTKEDGTVVTVSYDEEGREIERSQTEAVK